LLQIIGVSIKTHGIVLTFDGYTPLGNYTALTINGTHVGDKIVIKHFNDEQVQAVSGNTGLSYFIVWQLRF